MFENICTTEHWKKERAKNMQAARENKAITRGGDGVTFWVIRAKRCHDIAMQRRPICGNHVTITNTEYTQGALYATAPVRSLNEIHASGISKLWSVK